MMRVTLTMDCDSSAFGEYQIAHIFRETAKAIDRRGSYREFTIEYSGADFTIRDINNGETIGRVTVEEMSK